MFLARAASELRQGGAVPTDEAVRAHAEVMHRQAMLERREPPTWWDRFLAWWQA